MYEPVRETSPFKIDTEETELVSKEQFFEFAFQRIKELALKEVNKQVSEFIRRHSLKKL